jgi:hypothetical protein
VSEKQWELVNDGYDSCGERLPTLRAEKLWRAESLRCTTHRRVSLSHQSQRSRNDRHNP